MPAGRAIGDAAVEPLPVVTAVAVPVIEPRLLVGTPDPVAPSDATTPEPDVVLEELSDSGVDVPLLAVDVPAPVDDEMDDVVAVCINSIEMPLLARTDPV